jgi:hypothetical protein
MPCCVSSSPKASITSTLLVDMLKELEKQCLFDHSSGKPPFLLLDGYHSRTRNPFLKYINDDAHKWMVCIGVPYAIHLWKVLDSS